MIEHPDPATFGPHCVGRWWACSEPERPGDLEVIYKRGCSACDMKMRADALLGAGNQVLLRFSDDGSLNGISTLSKTVAEVAANSPSSPVGSSASNSESQHPQYQYSQSNPPQEMQGEAKSA